MIHTSIIRFLELGVLPGVVIGVIVMITGLKKRKKTWAFVGLAAGIVGGIGFGIALSLILSGAVMFMILRKNPKIKFDDEEDEEDEEE